MNRKYLLIASLLYCVLFYALLPWYRYIIDFDATGYINVAKLLAAGDYSNSINGFWSPLGSWMLVPFMKSGYDPVLSAKYINGVFGLLSLIAFYCLLKKLTISDSIRNVFLFFVIVMLFYFAFYELFGDLLQV